MVEGKFMWLIRHGESMSNAGFATDSASTYPLTVTGDQQAADFAQKWGTPKLPYWPQVLISSPMERAKQTARWTQSRFPNAPLREWDVEEFTMLCPAHYNNTTHEQREPQVRRYWDMNNPDYCDGVGAESFRSFMKRVDDLFRRVAHYDIERIAVFTHGNFMRGVLWSILHHNQPEIYRNMARFRRFMESIPVPNLHALELHNVVGNWSVRAVCP